MIFKKKIKFDLRKISKSEVIKIDGIKFSGIAYILVFIDGVNLFDLNSFDGSFLVFNELKNSTLKTGSYLLFTSVSGIADDASWECVEVLHDKDSIIWNIERDDTIFSYTFDKKNYLREVCKIELKIKNLNSNLKLEPIYVIYPEIYRKSR